MPKYPWLPRSVYAQRFETVKQSGPWNIPWPWCKSRCACLVTWFCYHLITKPGNKTAPPYLHDLTHIQMPISLCLKIKWVIIALAIGLFACLAPYHHLDQCWCIINYTLMNKLWWNSNKENLIKKWFWKYCLLNNVFCKIGKVIKVLGAISLQKCSLTSIGIAIIKKKPSHDSLIFIMEITISGKTVFVLRMDPVYLLLHISCPFSHQ